MANFICLGVIRIFLLSIAALPANSKTSAVKYSIAAVRNIAAFELFFEHSLLTSLNFLYEQH